VAEARLVTEALAGAQSAFARIVQRYQRPVISLIERMVSDRSLAEELAQDTFVKAYRHLAAFDTKRRLSSWLFRIAHNTAVDALRRARPPHVSIDAVDPRSGLMPAEPAVQPAPDHMEQEALGRAIEAAMAQLRPEFVAAIVLRYEEGLSFEEIGHVLGVPEATARSHVHRARKDLSRLLTEAGWQPLDHARKRLSR
jgi:RNA polymerase sigma-70 factor (ECF subfamily)